MSTKEILWMSFAGVVNVSHSVLRLLMVRAKWRYQLRVKDRPDFLLWWLIFWTHCSKIGMWSIAWGFTGAPPFKFCFKHYISRYPAIGTRFVHSSEGDLLVNRFVPCSKCASDIAAEAQCARDDAEITHRKNSKGFVSVLWLGLLLNESQIVFIPTLPLSSWCASSLFFREHVVRGSKTTGDISTLYVIHCFSIEECMLAGSSCHEYYPSFCINCLKHSLLQIVFRSRTRLVGVPVT